MPDLQPTSLYLAVIMLVALRAFHTTAKRMWRTHIVIAIAVGVGSLFIPTGSHAMALLLAFAFLAGTLGLSSILIQRWGQGGSSFSGKLLIMFTLVLISMFATAGPLLLMVYLQQA